jgi:hypothetical protein
MTDLARKISWRYVRDLTKPVGLSWIPFFLLLAWFGQMAEWHWTGRFTDWRGWTGALCGWIGAYILETVIQKTVQRAERKTRKVS